MSKNKLYILDGHALVYRMHFAFINRPLINSKGINTSAITGFTRAIWDLYKDDNVTHLAVAFDPKGPTFRHEIYEEYKAHRDKQPEDISTAIPYIKQIIEGFGIPIIMKDGFEADDVIGTIAKKAGSDEMEVYMMTPDKDYAQLVDDNVFMYKPKSRGNEIEILGPKEICEQWEIERVEQVIDILGLMGDSADNIPGIPGVGPKTAKTLIKKYGSIENIIANSAELKGKLREKVENNIELALLSKKLVIIDTHVDVEYNEVKFRKSKLDREKLEPIFKELEFRSLATNILNYGKPKPQVGVQGDLFSGMIEEDGKQSNTADYSLTEKNISNTKHDYKLVEFGAVDKLVSQLESLDSFCFDTETSGLEAIGSEIVGMSFSWEEGVAYYVPVYGRGNVLEKFRKVFEDESIIKIGQNLKFDIKILKWHGIEVNGFLYDTMIMHYLIEPDQRHGMDFLSENYLKYKPVSIETLIGKKGKGQLSMTQIAAERIKDYAAEDADITFRLYKEFLPLLKQKELEELYVNIEEPLIKVLSAMEMEGINLDSDYLNEYSDKLGLLIKDREKEIYSLAGYEFNISSPSQVGELLFEKLEIPYRWTKTKTGKFSTNEEKLQELSQKYKIVRKILDYRGLTKLKSTYVDALPPLVNKYTGRLHTTYNQAVASTGRLSSNNPNLQNIPIRTEEGRLVRKAFIPKDENYILLAADYSQIELRLIAEISGDEAMLDAFINGLDIHTATAAKVFGIPIEEVTKEQRRHAKTVNFSIIYGAGSTNLSRQLDISRKEAKELIDEYFRQYPGLKKYMDEMVKFARENGYVETLSGRKRFLRDINSRNGMMRSNAERMAINSPIQGTAADMIKIAMKNIRKRLISENLDSRMLLQVHDELIFDAKKTEIEILKKIVDEEMKNALPNLKVPVLVDMGTGLNWLEAH